jgi:uncharacterized protein (TIGR02646 family)
MVLVNRRGTIAEARTRLITRYQDFKEVLRRDFHHSCAYCGVWESQANGSQNFSVDHFVPKSIEPTRECDPDNLLYACMNCNRYKSATYPYDMDGRGWEILDPCSVDLDEHYRIKEDDELEGLSSSGKYMIEKFRLNGDTVLRKRRLRQKVKQAVILVHQGRNAYSSPHFDALPTDEKKQTQIYFALAAELIKELLPRRMPKRI